MLIIKKQAWQELGIVFLLISLFFLVKLFNVTYRYGDGNAYLYMAKVFLEGSIPYRDFFLADPPFLVIFLTPFYIFFKNNLLLFQFVPMFLEISTAFCLYLYLKSKGNLFAPIAPLIHLFSFSVVSTSDYLTGVQLTSFLLTVGLLLLDKYQKLAGAAFALACLTKLYAAPFYLGYLIFFTVKKDYKRLLNLILGSAVITIIIMIPFMVIGFDKMVEYLLIHQLNRPPGLNKAYILQFFLKREWLLLISVIPGLYSFRPKGLLAGPFILSVSFFLIFPDLYYMYLDSLLPLLVIFLLTAANLVVKKINHQVIPLTILSLIYIFFNFSSLSFYYKHIMPDGTFLNADEVSEKIASLPAGDIYGLHEIAPLVALKSKRKLFENFIDTNSQAFASKGLDKEVVSKKAVKEGVFLIGKIIDRPDLKVVDKGFEGYFQESYFQYCKRQLEFDNLANQTENKIIVYFCKKD